jgi:hypothetical protein
MVFNGNEAGFERLVMRLEGELEVEVEKDRLVKRLEWTSVVGAAA